MKFSVQWPVLAIILSLFYPFAVSGKSAPREIGGIALGSKVDSYPEIVQSNFLKDVVVTDWHGFRKGVISYGTCRYDGIILKIDMKYDDRSKEFFNTILTKFRENFGEPASWNGDSFGVMFAWKWNFIDSEQNQVSLTLQHNGKNSNETLGNVVKLSYPDKIEEERLCFADVCEQHKEKTDENRLRELKKTGWSYFIPR